MNLNSTYSRRNLEFLLFEVFKIHELKKYPYFANIDEESVQGYLDLSETIAEKYLRPFFKATDQMPASWHEGKVAVHPAIKSYYEAYTSQGLMAATFDPKFGGFCLPKSVYALGDFIIGNAHNGMEMFTALTHSGAKLLLSFASDDLIDRFVPGLIDGTLSATMCLTEPQAGSSLQEISTLATLKGANYVIKGQKIFISAGDHDITQNIIHLVLAKTTHQPNKISLFAVPKYFDDKQTANDVSSIGIYHKMGQKSTPAVHLEFGANENCNAYLIGEEGKGLQYMFQMMNAARLGVGLAGTYMASAAYYISLKYANERIQGKRKDETGSVVTTTIIHHADIRRMLYLQKSIFEGALSLIQECNLYLDLIQVIDNEDQKEKYQILLDLLTPVAKTYGSEKGIESISHAMQILGGYGYTEDFKIEQLYRDARILSIYEGTTGIQSLTLLGRNVLATDGKSILLWKEKVITDLASALPDDQFKYYVELLMSEISRFENCITHLIKDAKMISNEYALRDATLFMEYFGIIIIGWQWIKQGIVAKKALNAQTPEVDFYKSKFKTMKFYFQYEWVKVDGLVKILLAEDDLTYTEKFE